MTDYGRSPGSEPWYPEDPQYGDPGWTQQGPGGSPAPQAGQAQQHDPTQYHQGHYGAGQGYPQQYVQQQGYGPEDPYGTGQNPVYDPGYGQSHQDPGGHPYPPHQGQDPTQQGPYPGQQAFPGQRHPGHEQQYPMPHHPGGHEQYAGDWGGAAHPGDGGGQQGPYGYQQDPSGYYGGQEGYDRQVPYAGQQPPPPYPGQQSPPYPGQQAPPGYPGQQPPQPGQYAPEPHESQRHEQHRPAEDGEGPDGASAPPGSGGPDEAAANAARNEWDESIPEETHPFFTGGDGPAGDDGNGGDHGDERDDGRDEEPRKKGRSGTACLVIAVVLVATVGGVGYFGYQFYESRFGPPPDFAGGGTGTVQVDVPDGANGSDIAALLLKKGVVKSEGAFIAAQNKNPKGNTIQAGLYSLKKEMSGQSVVALMLDPHSRNALIVPEGTRDVAVYALIDKQLGLKAGTTQSVAKSDYKSLGLPAWADDAKNIKDPLEGFLFPASYPAAKGTKPETVLKEMVGRANEEYTKYDLTGNAKKVGLENPWQLLTVASLVQAEGKTHEDFQKVAEVVYNRLKTANTETNGKLQFDSTYNYLKNQHNIDISQVEINSNQDPYNTYTHAGLPPGPIDNPGEDAISAAMSPTHDGWMYFVATDGADKTQFAKTYAQFQQLKEKFNAHQQGLGG